MGIVPELHVERAQRVLRDVQVGIGARATEQRNRAGPVVLLERGHHTRRSRLDVDASRASRPGRSAPNGMPCNNRSAFVLTNAGRIRARTRGRAPRRTRDRSDGKSRKLPLPESVEQPFALRACLVRVIPRLPVGRAGNGRLNRDVVDRKYDAAGALIASIAWVFHSYLRNRGRRRCGGYGEPIHRRCCSPALPFERRQDQSLS